jgi:thiol-disulfide isomerase/thioredoxin
MPIRASDRHYRMKILSRLAPVALAACALFTNASCQPKTDSATTAAAPALPIIGPAPAWTIKDLDGREVSAASLKGKVVVVDFWATWCGPCVSELPNLAKLYKKYENNPGVVFCSIDTNEPASTIKPFMGKYNYSFNVLIGNLTPVSKAYGVEGIPTKFLIDRSGKIQFKHIGGGLDPKVIDDLSREIDELLSISADKAL